MCEVKVIVVYKTASKSDCSCTCSGYKGLTSVFRITSISYQVLKSPSQVDLLSLLFAFLRFCVFAFLRFCGGNAPNYARVNVASSSSCLICLCWCHTFWSKTFWPIAIWSTTWKIRLVDWRPNARWNQCRPTVCRSNVCRPNALRSKGMEPSCY